MAETDNQPNGEINMDGLNILRSMCERYVRRDGERIVIEISEPQQAALGAFLIQAVFGFVLGLESTSNPGVLAAPSSNAAPRPAAQSVQTM
jgi:hypothetical protein